MENDLIMFLFKELINNNNKINTSDTSNIFQTYLVISKNQLTAFIYGNYTNLKYNKIVALITLIIYECKICSN